MMSINLVGEAQHDRQPHPDKHGSPKHLVVVAGPDFIDLQGGRTDLVSVLKRHWRHQRRQ